MNRDMIYEIPSGSELDELVANYLFGGSEKKPHWYRWFYPVPKDIKNPFYIGPRFSTEIAAAWEVVEEITGGMIQFRLEIIPGNRVVYAKFVDTHQPIRMIGGAFAPKAPLAICRAGLLTLEAKEQP